ncbi:hypothetical protein [Microbulbifer celer]|uniref:Uncharacterized protein n=1 Tax=Microbulbifer celer TaxID=435905 RepID=A0ABW3UF16_9GAMM|nr:hypothetical protein [Microbulbifer celer]UFN58120.1 hypothetical protein LPW13_03460 [Microbulbifer celer]
MKHKEKVEEVVDLQTNDENKLLQLSSFELFGNGAFKCRVTLSSRGFAYTGDAYFDNGVSFINDLEMAATDFIGSAELKEDYNDHFIKLEVNSMGHVIVSGTFIEYSDHSQNMSFEFKTDQTCLGGFINAFKKVVLRNS